ncbi:MAG: RNA polymerase factor sigma-54 [Brotaphodocola sp.]
MLEHELRQEQRQVLSTGQLQSLEILTFTNQELNAFLNNEYLENPMLEDPGDKKDEVLKDLEQVYEKGTTYKEEYHSYGEEDCNRKDDLRAAEPDEMEEMILGQLDRRAFNSTEWKAIEYLVKCLDEKGFFVYEPMDIARAARVPADVVEACLKQLKQLEPAGIFARDVSECLVLQLEHMGVEDDKLYTIVEDYLSDLLHGRISYISRGMHLSTAKVKEYINLISRLNPRPIMSIRSEKTAYVVPDILADYEKGEWDVQLNDKWMGECRFNDYYIRMMQKAEDENLRQYFQEKLERAQFVVNCVEQRRQTLIRITKVILDYQQDYFFNDGPLKPMAMEDVAQMTGMHVSTVSRAVKDKYLQCRKVYLLRNLFTAAASSEAEVSVLAAKDRIRSLIQSEDMRAPFSDAKIAEILKEEGIELSRRTVAKYRIQMGIQESRHRMHIEKRD